MWCAQCAGAGVNDLHTSMHMVLQKIGTACTNLWRIMHGELTRDRPAGWWLKWLRSLRWAAAACRRLLVPQGPAVQ